MANGNRFLKGAVNGWWMGSIASLQSGEPIDVVLAGNRSNQIDQGQQDRANINTAAFIAANPCSASNPCAYTPVAFNASAATNLKIIYPSGGGIASDVFDVSRNSESSFGARGFESLVPLHDRPVGQLIAPLSTSP